MKAAAFYCTVMWALLRPQMVAGLDLSNAVVLVRPEMTRAEKKAVSMLITETEKRSGIRWAVEEQWPEAGRPVIAIGQRPTLEAWGGPYAKELAGAGGELKPEGFHVEVKAGGSAPVVYVIGDDARGALFGAGYLLRSLHSEFGRVEISDAVKMTSAPRYALRGHQLGYRPKTHSYDAWDLALWEQYLRDLVVFGCNAVELIPPRSDDDATSPHFPMAPLAMLGAMSGLADDYGLDVWLWYPAMDKDYSDSRTVEFALREWAVVFEGMRRLDAVFVPGGDPGHTAPDVLMRFLEKQSANLHRSHPGARLWVSPQSFNEGWMRQFLEILRREEPAWLSGVVFGPQVRMSLPALRAALPERYPIRHYPDITHTRQCQYPVPDWDTAFAITEGRECINPRPRSYAAIFRLLQPHTVGFITYSEGCNDDVNKAVWSALGWDPDRNVVDILREYSRYFIGPAFEDDFTQGLLALERNWQGPLLANNGVFTTLTQFQSLERRAGPKEKLNWRLQQALYRAYYDAYVRRRLLYETELEEKAMAALGQADRLGTAAAMAAAEAVLHRARSEPVATQWRQRVFELGESLFQSIRMQLSVPRHQAIAVDRGANLDTLDYPLNNRPWLLEQFAALRQLPDESARRRGLDTLVEWRNPGPGGFYDDLGQLSAQPHLVRGRPYEQDPAFLESAHVGFEEGDVADEPDEKRVGAWRYAWLNHAQSLNETPLRVQYRDLDPQAKYKVRLVYGGDSPKRKIRLVANDGIEIHPLIEKPWPVRPIEFDVPSSATAGGQLTLSWYREAGLGGNGRGCQVSELWLMKREDKKRR